SFLQAELGVGVEEFDAVDAAVGGDVDVEFVGDYDRSDVAGFLFEAKVGDVGVGIVGQFHGGAPFINVSMTIGASELDAVIIANASARFYRSFPRRVPEVLAPHPGREAGRMPALRRR